MRTRRLLPIAGAAVALLVALAVFRTVPAASPAAGETLKGKVTAVIDGDTIRVKVPGRGEEKVRLIGVDSQELDDEREPVRLMAFLAKRFVFSRLFQTTVELLPGPEARDDYGRLLAFVRTAGGDVFNVTLVREGYAFAFLKFPFDESLQEGSEGGRIRGAPGQPGPVAERALPRHRSRGGGPARRRGPDRPLPLPALVQARRLPPPRGRRGGFRCGHPLRGLPVAPRLPRLRGPDGPGDRIRRALQGPSPDHDRRPRPARERRTIGGPPCLRR